LRSSDRNLANWIEILNKICALQVKALLISVYLVAASFFWFTQTVRADSTSPRLAAYYDQKMLLCGQTAYQWQGQEQPVRVAENISQVGVGRNIWYGLDLDGRLLAWRDRPDKPRVILGKVKRFAAGQSGIFAIRTDSSLWYMQPSDRWFNPGDIASPVQIADNVIAAAIGDSADYYVTRSGRLYVKGLAHRGQYGDGKLQSSENFVAVAKDVVSVKAHTGHALLLTRTGTVMGTGGNIFGPLGRHGIGDKAVRWGEIFKNAQAIATGSSHSLALRKDGSLWHWGRDIGLDPKRVLSNVIAAAADSSGSIALSRDGTLWQWQRGERPKRYFRCP